MKNIEYVDLRFFERIFNDGGYVLNFSSHDFHNFIFNVTGISITGDYCNNVENSYGSSSKGNILKYFLNNESSYLVIKLLKALIQEAEMLNYTKYGITERDIFQAKEILNKYDVPNKIIENKEFKLSAMESLAKIIGNTYTGSEITALFKKAGFPEIQHDGTTTKWIFVYDVFENMQKSSIEGFYNILKVLKVLCDPQEYIFNVEKYDKNLVLVNRILEFYNLQFDNEGKLRKLNTYNESKDFYKFNKNNEKYDVFISHSSNDKCWVDKLYEELLKLNFKVWYDKDKIQIGDPIREKINQVLNKCDYVIVVLSKDFINNPWPKKEYDSLHLLMNEGKLLPIIHRLDKSEIASFDSSLLNIHYLSTENFTPEQVAKQIYGKIKKDNIE